MEQSLRDCWRMGATSRRAACELFDAEREALLHPGGFQRLREKLTGRVGHDLS